MLGENVRPSVTSPNGRLSRTPYKGQQPGPRLQHHQFLIKVCLSFPLHLSIPNTNVATLGLAGPDSPFFVKQHANHTHSCLTCPVSARTHLLPTAHRPGGCVLETFSADVASSWEGKMRSAGTWGNWGWVETRRSPAPFPGFQLLCPTAELWHRRWFLLNLQWD